MNPEEIAARLLYRDADILVLDKPAGLAVHRAPGAGANLEALLPLLSFGLKWAPKLCHRLDRETSGCLVLGRHPQSWRTVNQLFADGAVAKTYWAVVEGVPAEAAGTVELPLLQVHRGRSWRIVPDPAGQAARTDWRLLGSDSGRSWLELTPHTGRTHQIRVHCAALGHPVVGDETYGDSRAWSTTLHLHARAVSFSPKPKRPPVSAVAPPPPHMLKALAECGYSPSG